jgi:outer membrane protein W
MNARYQCIHIRKVSALVFSILLATASNAPTAHAGFIEIGASGSYKKSNIAVDAYDESMSLTGSVAYYLTESSAIEASYTDGTNKRAVSPDVVNGHVTQMFYTTAGLDFIYTFGGKDTAVRPYIKGGTNYIITKRIVDQYRQGDGTLWPSNSIDDTPGLVPSTGFGVRIGLTEAISLKVGVDGWTSRPINKQPVTVDWFGRAGLSWFF